MEPLTWGGAAAQLLVGGGMSPGGLEEGGVIPLSPRPGSGNQENLTLSPAIDVPALQASGGALGSTGLWGGWCLCGTPAASASRGDQARPQAQSGVQGSVCHRLLDQGQGSDEGVPGPIRRPAGTG